MTALIFIYLFILYINKHIFQHSTQNMLFYKARLNYCFSKNIFMIFLYSKDKVKPNINGKISRMLTENNNETPYGLSGKHLQFFC